MLSKIHIIFNSVEKKRLLSNFLSLFILQGANYLLPLLTVPYLIRVLGVNNFGLLAFATAIIVYFQVITDYGFNLTATREVSLHRDNKEKLVEIFSSVLIIKFTLVLISLIVLLGLVLFFDRLRSNQSIYFLTFGLVVGQALFPIWFFQGMEKMKYISYINIGSRLLFTLAIFVFVKSEADMHLVPLLNSLGAITGGTYAIYLIKKEFEVSISFQPGSVVKRYLVDGWHVFLSRMYVNLYTTTNIVVLGLFTNNTVVGYFSIAEKIVTAISGLYVPVTQTFYPYMAHLYENSKSNFFRVFSRLNAVLLGSSVLITLLVFLFKSEIIALVAGRVDPNVLSIFSILMFSILTSPFGASFTNGLLVLKQNRLVSKVVRDTMILNMLMVIPLVGFYQAVGLAVTYVLGQLFHTLYYMYSYTNVVSRTNLDY